MKSFFKLLTGSCLGTLLGLTLFAGMGALMLMGAMATATQFALNFEDVEPVEINSILHLQLKSGLTEQVSSDPLDNIDLSNFEVRESLDLPALLEVLQAASLDDRVDGIYLDIIGDAGSTVARGELRQALQAFRDNGKWIVAHSDSYRFQEYHLASVANEVFMSPLGDVELVGLSMEMLYFTELLTDWNIDVQVFRARDNIYKSAVEPFTELDMSKENMKQLQSWLSDVWTDLVSRIENSRGLEAGQVGKWISNQQSLSAEICIDLNLIDQSLYSRDVLSHLHLKSKGFNGHHPRLISPMDYAKAEQLWPKSSVDSAEGDFVAALTIEGTIMPDELSGDGMITPSSFRAKLDRLRNLDGLQALVLRINSPGGDAIAAESMWKDLKDFTNSTPVVVSMGQTVASGGYYLACAANTIVAEPNTLTGSIGVFGLLPNFESALQKHAKVRVQKVETHPGASTMSVLRRLSKQQLKTHQRKIDSIYDIFLNRVATGRGLTNQQAHSIARGRIWSGLDALEQGLIDQRGGWRKAIALAKGDRKDLTTRYLVPKPAWEEQLTEWIKTPESRLEDLRIVITSSQNGWAILPWVKLNDIKIFKHLPSLIGQ